jgi:tetratricopeptide (TPR) repeat protein
MRRTGVRSCIAACAELLVVLAGVLAGRVPAPAADCPAATSASQERLARLRELEQAAQTEMRQQRFSEAVGYFQEMACIVPKSAGALYNLGAAEAASGDFLSARKSLRAARNLDPSNPLPLVMLARVNFSLGDIDGLKASLREAAASFPKDGHLHALLARFLTERSQLDLALAEALRAQQAEGVDSASRVGLAVLENALGAYQEAVVNASALERQDGLPASMRASAAGVAGLSYEGLGQRDEAIRHLREAIRLDPSRENSYVALAFLLEKAQKYADAVAVLEQGRRNLPNSVAFLLPLGSNLVRAEKYEEGVGVLRELLRQNPGEADAYLQIADALRKTGRPGEEAQILIDLRRRKPDYPMIGVMIARAMLNADSPDYAKVLAELARAEGKTPSDADIFYLRGKVFTQMNREGEAVAELRHAIDLRPMEPGPHYQLGRLYQKLGKPELAKQEFERLRYLEENSAPK